MSVDNENLKNSRNLIKIFMKVARNKVYASRTAPKNEKQRRKSKSNKYPHPHKTKFNAAKVIKT